MRKRADAGKERAGAARDAVGERIDAAREATGERLDTAREATTQRMENAKEATAQRLEATGARIDAAKEATGERVEAVRQAASELQERVKPKLRGVIHEGAFPVSVLAGAILVLASSGGRERFALTIYAISLSALLGTSAVYHRVDWKSPSARRWMRRLDHSMIFVLIAGTLTPFALLVLEGPLATGILIAVWSGAVAGIVVEMIWTESPKWVHVAVYGVVGWIGAIAFPGIVTQAGVIAGALVALGGVLYTLGAVVYARQRPDPRPAVFGYHEIFHVLVVAAAAAHFTAIALYAGPAA